MDECQTGGNTNCDAYFVCIELLLTYQALMMNYLSMKTFENNVECEILKFRSIVKFDFFKKNEQFEIFIFLE